MCNELFLVVDGDVVMAAPRDKAKRRGSILGLAGMDMGPKLDADFLQGVRGLIESKYVCVSECVPLHSGPCWHGQKWMLTCKGCVCSGLMAVAII